MAIGDAVNTLSSVANDAYLTIQPGTDVEWIIHNILVSEIGTIELYITDGSNPVKIISLTGGLLDYHFHATNSIYYTVKNVSGGTLYIGFDGIVSK